MQHEIGTVAQTEDYAVASWRELGVAVWRGPATVENVVTVGRA